ncbi:hypothetical protein TDB9533_04550 [Thalassocella blandensis]|nr:hypothetical protein TDB9533_04550 [Thalassocella blandensis]
MRPAKYCLIAYLGWFVSALLLNLLILHSDSGAGSELSKLWWMLGGIITVITYREFLSRPADDILQIERQLPPGLSVGTDNLIELKIRNTAEQTLHITLTELVDDAVRVEGLPITLTLKPQEGVSLSYVVHPLQRGSVIFEGIDCLIETPWRFWSNRYRYLAATEVKVFPNFSAISHFELLAHGQQVGQLGIHLNQRRGEGLDFHQLREFRPGDALRQVDWKATSRALKPISREFQDERDQDIIFLLDNGRRMRTKDGELSHFDHCLNAFLLTAYVALRQGDAVGFQTFGSIDRWINPIKGKNNLNTLLHQVYDIHSSVATSDYLTAAENLMNRHRKRSLVIIISNFHEQDKEDLLAAYQLLQRNHLVIIACLQEQSVGEKLDEPVRNFDQALSYSSAYQFYLERQQAIKRLVASGAIVLDDKPSQLHIALVNEYYALKRSGRI